MKLFYIKMNLTWVSAQGQCDQIGGYLAEPASEVEQEFLYSVLKIIEVGNFSSLISFKPGHFYKNTVNI